MPTSLEHLAGGTVSFSDGGSGVQGREMFLIDGPVLECARRNVADLGRGVDGGFCSNEEEKGKWMMKKYLSLIEKYIY